VLNRRHLRIKIFHALYAYFQHSKDSLDKGEKELFFSIAKMYEMYLYLLLTFVDIAHYSRLKIEEKKKKQLPTKEDLNPNLRFVDNPFIKMLESNSMMNKAIEREKLSWSDNPDIIKRLFTEITGSVEYQNYMAAEESTPELDRQILVTLFKKYIVNFEPLQNYFEDKSIFWVDDLDLASSMVIKTLKTFEIENGIHQPILDLYKDADDEVNFVKTMFRKVILQSEENEGFIHEKAENWDMERIAMIDMILMKMALTEAREFNQIPIKVTLNEYIEISKFYSTPRSSVFINGILDKLFADLKVKGLIRKIGRGLIES
jgi:transcription antitermination protein NusB